MRPFVCYNNSFSNFDSPVAKQEAKGPASKEGREKGGGENKSPPCFLPPLSSPLLSLFFFSVEYKNISFPSHREGGRGKEA